MTTSDPVASNKLVKLAATTVPPAVTPQAPPAQLGPVASLVSSFLGLVAAPFLSGGSDVPGPIVSVLEYVYAASRRLQSFFFDSNPTAQPVQIAQTASGTITGIVGGLDPDRDFLQYSVTRAPTSGSVVINDQGQYTYTPGAALAATGGTDTFVVTVGDGTEFTLNSLFNAILGRPNNATALVTVTVAPPGAAATIGVGSHPQGVTLSADGTRAYVTNSSSGSVSVIDTTTSKVIATIAVGNTPTGAVATSGGKLYVANQFDDDVSVIDTATNTVTKTIAVGDGPQALALAGSKLYVTNSKDASVSVIDTASDLVTSTIGVGDLPVAVAASTDGARVYVTKVGGTMSVIDVATNGVVAVVGVGSNPRAVAVSGDGRTVYVTDFDRGNVTVIDTASNAVTGTISVGAFPDAVVVSPDGTKLYVTSYQDGTVSVVDTSTHQVFGTVSLDGTAAALAISADGSRLFAPNLDGHSLSVVAVNAAAAPPAGTPTAPSAAPSDTDINGAGYQQYTVYNLTPNPVEFIGYDHQPGFQPFRGVAVGTIIPPGGNVKFTLGPDDWGLEPTFQSGTIGTADYARFDVDLIHIVFNDTTNVDQTSCSGAGAVGRCTGFSKHSAVLLPENGSTVTIGNDDPELQSRLVNMLCRQSANCDFQMDGPTPGLLLPERVWGSVVHNLGDTIATKTIGENKLVSHTESISITVGVSASIDGAVTASFQTDYTQSWTQSYAFDQILTVPVPTGQYAWVSLVEPINREVGTFEVVYKGVTFVINDVYFDMPDPTRPQGWNSHVQKTGPDYGAV